MAFDACRTRHLSRVLYLTTLLVATSPVLLSHSGRLKGRVLNGAGNPIHEAQVEVYLWQHSELLVTTSTDHEGRFQFSGLPPGQLEIVAFKEGLEPQTTLIDGEDRDREIEVILEAAYPSLSTDISVFGAIPRTAASSSVFRREEFNRRVIEEPGNILRVVPGLSVIQHAGGGKANQYLTRGFDADHGTDIAISFAGIPVNMVSHAHGQGYADLSFVIPETLQAIDVYKGPYFAELGNLSTAGATTLQLREEFDDSFVRIQGGQWSTARVVLGLSPNVEWTRGFFALEGHYTDGPFLNPQDLKRLNLITRWSFDLTDTQTLSFLGSAYDGNWNASGQIPLREVEAGRLSLFGSIDPSEGGSSSRYNFSVSHQKVWSDSALNSQFYAFHYDMDLHSNFTFFLNDPIRGDGINQTDDRASIGGHLQFHHHHHLAGMESVLSLGMDYRQDFADVGLFRQEKRQVFDTITFSHINERNVGFFLQEKLDLHPTLSAILGLRHDRFRFQLDDLAGGVFRGEEYRSFTGPKVSLVYAPWQQPGPEFYANYGRGFHSNDTRSVMAGPAGVALAAADGFEVGYRQIFSSRLEVSAAYWWMNMESELVWVGDEGTTEASGPTRRRGPELEVKWKLNESLFLDGALSHSRGWFLGTGDYIPRAPRLVASGGLSFETIWRLSGDLQFRHIGTHPLNEDGSFEAHPYTLADLFLKYRFSDNWEGVVTIQNLFDAKALEAQTYFESQLREEPRPVGDNHFNPAYPFTFRLGVQYNF